ncbi:hypothetical protein BT69DRAFT_881651 [Atractiella rhizophila]|nr:hypothetical protein BT69DRAFT_881651 [Atractiella rhizophila]
MERVLEDRRRASSPLSATPTPSERLQTISTTTDGSKERRSTFLHDFFEEPAREKLGEEVMELNVRSRRVLGEEEKVKLLERVRRGEFVPDITAGAMPAASNSSIPTLDPDFATTTSIPTSPFLTREAAPDPDFATTTNIPAQESSPKMEKNVAMDNISTFDPDIATSSLLAGSRSIPASTSLPRDPRQYLSLLSSTELALDSYPRVAQVLASLQLSTQIEDWSEEERKTVRAQVGEEEWLLIDGKDTLPLVSSSQTGGEVSESKMVQEGVRKSSFLDSFYDQPDNPPIASSSNNHPRSLLTYPSL